MTDEPRKIQIDTQKSQIKKKKDRPFFMDLSRYVTINKSDIEKIESIDNKII